MLFDDRLATVLRQRISTTAVARTQYRQLVDLVGAFDDDVSGARVDAAYAKLAELARMLPPETRAAILRDPAQRLRNPRLVAQLAQAEPAVAAAAIKSARLTEDQWLALAPALPVQARGVLREKTVLTPRMKTMFDQLGIQPRCLPRSEAAVATREVSAGNMDAVEAPSPLVADVVVAKEDIPVVADPGQEAIAAIVKRIEAFRKARQSDSVIPGLAKGRDAGQGIPRQAIRQAFDFTTDGEGRISWAESPYSSMTIGLRLGALDASSPLKASPTMLAAVRRRQPVTRGMIAIDGAPAVAGPWQVDAVPCFDPLGGRFIGYRGRMRRPAPVQPVADSRVAGRQTQEADSMRQMLHELRTPVNAIQGFAEVIQQQLFGSVPHEYRALAATIAGDAARILAGFDDLDRLARLESGALAIETNGGCAIFPVVANSIRQLESFTAARNSGFLLTSASDEVEVAMAKRELEAMLWRLLATMAGTVSPGEVLPIQGSSIDSAVVIRFGLPRALANREGDDLFDAVTSPNMQALSAGVFGAGFALRLAVSEARSAGGSLLRDGSALVLTLPILTERKPPLSHTLASRDHKGEE